jgi:glycosyltransferase involved in cell wall biosynthesis
VVANRARGDAARPRILVGLGETAGYCALLAEGLRVAGVEATHLNLGPDPMRYTDEPAPRLVRVVRWLAARRRGGPGPRAAWALIHRIALVWLFLDAVRRHDAFILRAGDSFFALRDLPLLRRLGKRVIVVFFGSDSRPSYLNGAEIAAGQDGARAAEITAAKRRMVERTERHATHVVVHPMSAQLHRRRAVAFLAMGIPRRVPPDPGPPPPATGAVRFLHAPSRPHDKGTDRVRAAIDEVRAAGLPVELRIVSGRPNAEVLEAIRESDVVIDQLYSDTPMAALAAEAAALGRPAIVGGYGWPSLNSTGADDHLPPTHRCHPDELADAIRTLAADETYRLDLGRRARRFLEERWAPVRVADRYLALLRDEVPADWWFEPAAIEYVLGAGASEDTIRDAVRRVLEVGGPAGLSLADKPHLVERLLALVSRDPAAVGG